MYFKEGEADVTEATPAFRAGMLLLAVLIILIGLFPTVVLNSFYF